VTGVHQDHECCINPTPKISTAGVVPPMLPLECNATSFNSSVQCPCSVCAPCRSKVIYNAAAARIKAPTAPTTEPARWLAALALAVAGPVDEVDEPVGEAVVLRVAVLFDPEPDPELPVPVPVGATPVPEALPIPLPAPRDGESPPPDEARGELVATDTTDDTDAEMEELAELLEPPELPELPEVAVADGVLLELEETAEQERSKYGVVLKGLP
jgi:hypothetical protein